MWKKFDESCRLQLYIATHYFTYLNLQEDAPQLVFYGLIGCFDIMELPRLRLSTKSTISAQIYVFLRYQITSANIRPGSTISENELSAHFKVSRQPVREALNSLEHDGLISVIPQKGTVVKKISVSDLKQVVFIRSSLECSSIDNIAKLSVGKYTKILNKLKDNLEEQKKKSDPNNLAGSFLPLDDKFHELICSFSDCAMTWQVVQSCKGQLDRIRYLSMGVESPLEGLISDHESILKGIENYDFEKAKELLNSHLHEVMITHKSIKKKYAEWFESEDN